MRQTEILSLMPAKHHSKGVDGFVAFTAKTALIEHYEKTLGAYHFKNQRMIIETRHAKILVERYFKTK